MSRDLVTIEPGGLRERWFALLYLADEAEPLRRYLAFYQRLGFRITHVERDYFVAARGYPDGLVEDGITVRDMVWMLPENDGVGR